jgi:hypothetical protein
MSKHINCVRVVDNECYDFPRHAGYDNEDYLKDERPPEMEGALSLYVERDQHDLVDSARPAAERHA